MTHLIPGINTCFAVKRWPRVADWAAIVRDELGLTDVQLSMDCLPIGAPDSRLARSYAAEVARTGLAVHGVFTGLGAYGTNLLLHPEREARDAAEAYYRAMIDLAAEAGARSAGGHVGALSVSDASDPATAAALRSEMIERMGELAAHAAARGLSGMLFENLAVRREPGASAAEARALERDLAGTDVPWRLCLDVGHPVALSAPGDADPLAPWLAPGWLSAPVVQLQQATPGSDGHGGFSEPEPAGVNLASVVQGIAAWEGEIDPLFLEVIPAHEADDDAVLRELRGSADALRAAIAAAG